MGELRRRHRVNRQFLRRFDLAKAWVVRDLVERPPLRLSQIQMLGAFTEILADQASELDDERGGTNGDSGLRH